MTKKNKKHGKQNKHIAKIQSVIETLFSNPYISIKKKNGFVYAERKGRDSVAIVLTRNNGTEVMMRYQPLIADGGKWYGCPITGSMDHEDEIPEECAVREIAEESGFIVDIDELLCLTSYIVCTQTNEICHLFTIDVTGLEQGKDRNTEMGESGTNKWGPLSSLLTSPYSASLIAYGLLKEGITA